MTDKRTLKFQMMMSPQEAAALDDWMFKHRIRSRAEAIRQLCQKAMTTEWDAVKAERERCASIAEDHHEDPTNDEAAACEGCGEFIAYRIRSGWTP